MTRARKHQVSLEDTPYYHIITRCVRRAFLCGKDKYSGKCYEHRRGLIVERIKYLASVFSINVCAYAVMSNHYHLVIEVKSTKGWSDKQVLSAWAQLYQLPMVCDRFMKGEFLSKGELIVVDQLASEYRKRLMNLSWFMKCLNEHIAIIANKEDGCTGSFWEGRFKSQALLDERALLTCMAYVDLNPIRAAMARTPEQSNHTSIQARIKSKDSWLLGFGNEEIPYYLTDYIALVDYTGRVQLDNKRGSIANDIPEVFSRLNLDPDSWLDELKKFKSKGRTAVGTLAQLKLFCKRMKARYLVANTLTTALE